MEAFRIHEDQENRRPVQHQKQVNAGVLQQKRSALGAIDNNKPERLNAVEQPLKGSKVVSENLCTKPQQNVRKPSSPVLPVAQFEAFKVYEDSKIDNELLHERQRKLKCKDIPNVYKGTAEDRFITKKEVQEMEAKRRQEALSALSQLPQLEKKISNHSTRLYCSPMSIEKSDESNKIEFPIKTHAARDIFFQLEEYRSDIYSYLREHENRNRPKPGYMRKQPDITHNMRAILVDWLVEVAEEYKMHTETLYLAVNFIDRFLSYMSVLRAKLQLVGTAAMFIASKYEEIYPPEVKEFVYITDDTYNQRQVIRMEYLILKVLAFDLSVPTPLTFMTAICIANKIPNKTMYLAMYLCELSLMEAEQYMATLPSVLAASAIALARHVLGDEPWSDNLCESTGYKLADLKNTILFLNELFAKAPTLAQQAIQEKYKSMKYLHVSKLSPRKDDIEFKEDSTASCVQ